MLFSSEQGLPGSEHPANLASIVNMGLGDSRAGGRVTVLSLSSDDQRDTERHSPVTGQPDEARQPLPVKAPSPALRGAHRAIRVQTPPSDTLTLCTLVFPSSRRPRDGSRAAVTCLLRFPVCLSPSQETPWTLILSSDVAGGAPPPPTLCRHCPLPQPLPSIWSFPILADI